jgi:hypothetical protein
MALFGEGIAHACSGMKTISIASLTGIAALVVLRLNGVLTEVPALDSMVLTFMQSIHLA